MSVGGWGVQERQDGCGYDCEYAGGGAECDGDGDEAAQEHQVAHQEKAQEEHAQRQGARPDCAVRGRPGHRPARVHGH